MSNSTLESFDCKAYGFNPDRYCAKVWKKDEKDCHSKYKPCCDDSLKICPPTPPYMFAIYSSIGCLVFLVLIGALVYWKRSKAKKQQVQPWQGTSTTTGGPRGSDTMAAEDYYFGKQ